MACSIVDPVPGLQNAHIRKTSVLINLFILSLFSEAGVHKAQEWQASHFIICGISKVRFKKAKSRNQILLLSTL